MKCLKELSQRRAPIDQAWKILKLGASDYCAMDNCMRGPAGKLGNCRFLHTHCKGYVPQILSQVDCSRTVGTSVSWIPGLHFPFGGYRLIVSRHFKHVKEEASLSRDWLVNLWLVDRKRESKRRGRKQKLAKHVRCSSVVFQRQPSLSVPLGRWFSGKHGPEERSIEDTGPLLTQPPLSQSTIGFLEPSSPEELKFAPLLARPNLLITRRIEWANLVVGFEQENRYAILDACYPKQPVGFILEQSNVIARQLLRTRRPFVAHITDSIGNELFKVRRPFWWINSSIFAEIDGKEIGVVHRRWHLWRRVYDLYLGKMQFAVVENPGFWNWTFTLRDIEGNVLAEIDRNWRGFGFELFTDAGQYVIRFGDADHKSKSGLPEMIEELKVVRPLTLSERAVALALAVSLDNDYFSRHGGWGIPFVDIGE
ncbi:hypothetical protein Sjap_004079 [Stephania japonica]|uniref:Phospholipid scramblase n=1 Tax=Stephania japonica TaxID=461633 RepID=A0AAP0PKJ9_9MAGN